MRTLISFRRPPAMVLGMAAVLVVWFAAPSAGPTAGAAEGPAEITLTATADTWAGLPTNAFFGIGSPEDAEPPRGSELRLVGGWHDEHRGASVAFVDFDLPGVPADTYVDRAWLELYVERSYRGPLPAPMYETAVYVVNEPWQEATLDAYTSPRLDFDDSLVASQYAFAGRWARWDATRAVTHRLATREGHGFWLITDGGVTRFSSRETDRPPRLVLSLDHVEPVSVLFVPLATRGFGEADPQPPMTDPPAPPANADDRPWLVLTPGATALDFGDTPEIVVDWVNHTNETVTVILPVDASTYGWRMPMYLWQVTRPDGRPVRTRLSPRCGNTNRLVRNDFFDLAPGARRMISREDGRGWLNPPSNHNSFVEPGEYEVRLFYALDKEGGATPREVADLWAAARDMTVVSERITFTVSPPPGHYAGRLAASRLVQRGTTRSGVEAIMGPPDQVVDEEYEPDRRHWVYYLAEPREDEPNQLERPQVDNNYGENWRPRFVVTFNQYPRVREARLLP